MRRQNRVSTGAVSFQVLLGLVVASCDGSGTGPGGAAGARGSGGAGTGGMMAGTGGTGMGGSSGGTGGALAGTGGANTGAGGGGGTPGTGGAGFGGRGGSSSGSGGITGGDACQSDVDCPEIVCIASPCSANVCVLGTDGLRRCQLRTRQAVQAGSCMGAPSPCCQSDGDCTLSAGGECLPTSLGWCGGAAPPPGNTCRYNQCRADQDCTASPNGVCTSGYPRKCVYGPCRRNADCTARSGGTCVLGTAPTVSCESPAVYCHYDGDPCARNSDCVTPPGARYPWICVPALDLQGTRCIESPPPAA